MQVVIKWTWEDVQELRPSWNKRTCDKALLEVSKVLRDRSIEEGWQILRDLLDDCAVPRVYDLCDQLERDLKMTWCKEGHLFDGNPKRLVWSGEGAEITVKGKRCYAFDYYSPAYDIGVHPALVKWAKERGLYWECYDPGTFFLYKV